MSEAALRSVLPGFVGEQDQVAPLFSAKSVDGVRAYETARRLFKQGLPVDASGLLQASRITIYSLELEEFLSAGSRTPLNRLASLDPPHCKQWVPPSYDAEGGTGSEGSTAGSENRRNSRIHVADVSGYDMPTAMVRVDCSKGTYIRALARDLGEALGSGAFLSSLRRTRNGGIAVEDALTLDEAVALLSCPIQ